MARKTRRDPSKVRDLKTGKATKVRAGIIIHAKESGAPVMNPLVIRGFDPQPDPPKV
jgi:hypothetical protein